MEKNSNFFVKISSRTSDSESILSSCWMMPPVLHTYRYLSKIKSKNSKKVTLGYKLIYTSPRTSSGECC